MHSGTRSHDGDRVESLHSAMGTLASRSGSGPEDPQPGPAPAGPASRPAPPHPAAQGSERRPSLSRPRDSGAAVV